MKKITILIVNYNGYHWLKDLLPDINKQTYKNIQTIVVDNNSTDGSVDLIKQKYNGIDLIKLNYNSGFATGNNIGFKQSKGEYTILLNNDTRIPNTYVEEFIKVFDKHPNCAMAQSKITLLSNSAKIDTCGSYLTNTSFQYYIGNGKSSTDRKYNQEFMIFSTKGASMILRNDVIKEIGLFDSDYWSYYEETDLCHRAWVAGYEVWYWPFAVVGHHIGGTSTKFKNSYIQFHNYKNKLNSLLVNLELINLCIYIPVFLFTTTLIGICWIITGRASHTLSLLRALYWNIANILKTYKKRKKVQSIRKNKDSQIFKLVLRNPKLIYYKYLLSDQLRLYEE